MKIETLFDEPTSTLTYVLWDEKTKDAVIIDPVLDFDPVTVSTKTESVEKLVKSVADLELNVRFILETHAHADHISSSDVLVKNFFKKAKIAIGANITAVQEVFKGVFNLGEGFKTDGSQFDRLLKDGETLKAGSLLIKAISTPGHTLACMSYQIDDVVFVGDVLFTPDSGTGRCDFPSGSSEDLYDSIKKLYQLPDETRLFVGHDYQPGGRELMYETTVGDSKKKNFLIRDGVAKSEFTVIRNERDKTLNPPKLIYPSVQVNIAAGVFPEAEDNGAVYLKLPVKLAHKDNM